MAEKLTIEMLNEALRKRALGYTTKKKNISRDSDGNIKESVVEFEVPPDATAIKIAREIIEDSGNIEWKEL